MPAARSTSCSRILFAPGTILYYMARREQGKPVFAKHQDWVVFAVFVAAALYASSV